MLGFASLRDGGLLDPMVQVEQAEAHEYERNEEEHHLERHLSLHLELLLLSQLRRRLRDWHCFLGTLLLGSWGCLTAARGQLGLGLFLGGLRAREGFADDDRHGVAEVALLVNCEAEEGVALAVPCLSLNADGVGAQVQVEVQVVECAGGGCVLPLRPEVGLDLLLVGDLGGVQRLVDLADDHLLLCRSQSLPFSLDFSNHFVWAL